MKRDSLAKYFGKEVWVIGDYVGPSLGNKKVHEADIETGLADNEQRAAEIVKSQEQPSLINPIKKIDTPSCLKNVRG